MQSAASAAGTPDDASADQRGDNVLQIVQRDVLPPGNVLYAVGSPQGSQADHLFRIDNYHTSEPVGVYIGQTYVAQGSNANLGDIGVDPVSGTMLGISWDNNRLYEVDPTDAQVIWNGASGDPAEETALEFDFAGALYCWGCNEKLFEIEPATGMKT